MYHFSLVVADHNHASRLNSAPRQTRWFSTTHIMYDLNDTHVCEIIASARWLLEHLRAVGISAGHDAYLISPGHEFGMSSSRLAILVVHQSPRGNDALRSRNQSGPTDWSGRLAGAVDSFR